jgi:hypothetical protein
MTARGSKFLCGLLFANAANPDIYHTPSRDFSPRFGFAWKPALLGSKTVIRGGFGLFVFGLGTTGVTQTGFSQSTQFVATLNGYLTPAATLANPFPDGIQQPTGSKLGLATYLGQSVSFFNPAVTDPYSVRWSFNIQRELQSNLLLEVGYQGNHAVHLNVPLQLNVVPAQYLSTSPVRDQAAIDRLTANVTNPFAGLVPGTNLNGSTVARSQLLVPYPQFTGVSEDYLPAGSSYFHALQARVTKRVSHGLQLEGNALYSRMMERRTWLNDSDPLPEKRVAAEDRPYRFVVMANYELPFGPGRRFARGTNPILGRILGGWKVGGNFTIQPGPPLTWGNVIYNGGDLKADPRRLTGVFDVTRFNREPSQQLSQNIRTFASQFSNLRADGVNNFDLSAIKDTRIKENLNLQYRCEFFNALNHPLFDAPNLTPTDSNFGRIMNQINLPRTIQMALRLVW